MDDVSFYVRYNNDGNIISDERNTYTYGEYGQLVGVTGVNNASYSYDERGNILTKTDNGETTSFTYANSEWKDQLTKVNDTELTYDANGNMVSYGDTQFTWDYGKSLSSVKGDEKSYYYNYDENGIRTSKTVNGKTTRFNTLGGVVLAQSDSTGIMYFQYDSAGAPIGFVYNDVQYLYITNISGDIIGITDAEGNPLAEYTYDAWGKLLDITTAEEDNEEQLSLANANPLRYRGYYYDNETGYYYLQSRYYNPEWGRFISADGFKYIDTYALTSINAYVYCYNNPIIHIDINGCLAAEAAGYSALYYFFNYVLPDIIIYGILTISGVLFIYLIVEAVVKAMEGAGSAASAPPPQRNDEAEKAWNNIPNSLKKGNKVDMSKFNTQLKNGQGKRASNGWRIQKDTAGHKGSEWKLFDKSGKRIASLKGDGTVVGK